MDRHEDIHDELTDAELDQAAEYLASRLPPEILKDIPGIRERLGPSWWKDSAYGDLSERIRREILDGGFTWAPATFNYYWPLITERAAVGRNIPGSDLPDRI